MRRRGCYDGKDTHKTEAGIGGADTGMHTTATGKGRVDRPRHRKVKVAATETERGPLLR